MIETNLRFGLSLLYEYCCVFSRFKSVKFRCGFNRANVIHLRNENYANLMEELISQHLLAFDNVTLEAGVFHDMSPFQVHQRAASIAADLQPVEQWTPNRKASIFTRQNHIIMNTKLVLSGDVLLWDMVKPRLFSALNACGRKLILIGEREPMQCKEYQIHGSRSIYREILDNCRYLEDWTVENTESLYSKDVLQKNLNLLQTSAFNIHIGRGGGQSVYAFHNDMITLGSGEDLWFLSEYIPKYFIDICPSPDEFMKCLNKRLDI